MWLLGSDLPTLVRFVSQGRVQLLSLSDYLALWDIGFTGSCETGIVGAFSMVQITLRKKIKNKATIKKKKKHNNPVSSTSLPLN